MTRSRDCVLRDVGGQALLVPIGAKLRDLNALILLNATGRRVWELLAEDADEDGLAALIAREFAVNAERARADVRAFLDRLRGLGLLEP
jgi:hypothetical protein